MTLSFDAVERLLLTMPTVLSNVLLGLLMFVTRSVYVPMVLLLVKVAVPLLSVFAV